ncbi:protein O-mannosyl-transferase family [Chloroflexota bacterium]
METKRFQATGRRLWNRAGDWLLAAALFAGSLALYSRTLAPSVATLFDDSLEFPLVSYRLGIAHPTGYPLYTLLGKVFTLGPWPNVAWGVNFLSAVASALTIALLYLIGRRLTRRRLSAVLGAVALAVSPVFWSQAVIAEVYALNSAFIAALLLLALHWAEKPLVAVVPFSLLLAESPDRERWWNPCVADREGRRRLPEGLCRAVRRLDALYRRFFPAVPPRRRFQLPPVAFVLAAVYGLSLTHHRLALLLTPVLLVFALLVEQRALSRGALLGPEHPDRHRWLQILRRPGVLLALCLFVPLLLYLYLPLRAHVGSLDGTYSPTWKGFWQWVTASGYSAFLAANPLSRDLNAVDYARLFWGQYGPVGLALALVGILALVHRPKVLTLTGLAFVIFLAFAVFYQVPDVEVFFIPAFLLTAIWIAAGLDHAADLLRPRGQSPGLRRFLAVCSLCVFLAAGLQATLIAARNTPDLDLSQEWGVHDYGQYLLKEPLPPESTVVGLLGEMTLLRYFQETEGLRTDIETIAADDERERRAAVEEALGRGRSVFITHPLPSLDQTRSLGAVNGLMRVARDRQSLVTVGDPFYEEPIVPRPADLELTPGLRLLGYGVHEHNGHWQRWARLRLWWTSPPGLDEPLKVSVRLLDAGGNLLSSSDAEPVAWSYPTTSWRPGEVVVDAYEIPLPSGTPAGEYTPLVIVYDPSTGDEQGRAELSAIRLEGNPVRPPLRALEAAVGQVVYARFGSLELLGFTPPAPDVEFGTGEQLPLHLLWQAHGQQEEKHTLSFWLEGESSRPLGETPLGGRTPVELWSDGEVAGQWPGLRIPEDVPSGTYRLKMRVLRDGQPLPWGRWLIPMGSDLELGIVQVGG